MHQVGEGVHAEGVLGSQVAQAHHLQTGVPGQNGQLHVTPSENIGGLEYLTIIVEHQPKASSDLGNGGNTSKKCNVAIFAMTYSTE